MEYELLDTGVFAEDRYFDVFVEYAKEGPEDLLIQITVHNRGPEAADLHVLPTLWFRNTWSWSADVTCPQLQSIGSPNHPIIHARHGDPHFQESLGGYYLYCQDGANLLFTDNNTNNERLFGTPNETPYAKDGINDFVVLGKQTAVNPAGIGTKAAAHYQLTVSPASSATIRLRLSNRAPEAAADPLGTRFEKTLELRRREADAFYRAVTPQGISEDQALVMRQAMAGMLWSKQYFYYDVDFWLHEHGADPMAPGAKPIRNHEWYHMVNEHIISMPDKWEYPWYAAWDLAFHTMALAVVDVDFAREQLDLMLRDFYIHPTGQIPAYEWNFSDVNPPVHAWATIFLHRTQQSLYGTSDIEFLKRSFGKLMMNFAWWVNRKDRYGKNVFEGGFLGLDNIGVFDRSAPLPTGGSLEQADGTAWVSLFCQNMLEIGVELAAVDPTYEDLSINFADHFLFIAHAMNHVGPDGMWDEEDGFYYDILRFPDGSATRLKVRSIVGLLPLCATTVIEPWQRERVPRLTAHLAERVRRMPELRESIHPTGPGHLGVGDRGLVALVNPDRLRRIMARLLDENEFLSPYGIRAVSRYHADHPYVFNVNGQEYRVNYLPAESDTGMFGGNSNWRGPIWMPINVLLIRAMLQFYLYYGDNFKVECPTVSGRWLNFFEVGQELANRLERIFLRDASGRRPVYGGMEKFQNDPEWRDNTFSMNTTTATMAQGWGPATRPAGRGSLGSSSICLATSTRSAFWRVARPAC